VRCDLRSEMCGVWCVVCGVWCVVCGVWCAVCGVWCVVCGVWCAVCGACGVNDYLRVILLGSAPRPPFCSAAILFNSTYNQLIPEV
jgi:hypothetical protein